MAKKYKMFKVDGGLFRIIALRDFGTITEGTIGGLIEHSFNLSHDGDCWIHYGASVINDARVYDNAIIGGKAVVFGNSRVYDNSMVLDDTEVYGTSRVYGYAQIRDSAKIYGEVHIFGNAIVDRRAIVSGKSIICGTAKISNFEHIYDEMRFCNEVIRKESSTVAFTVEKSEEITVEQAIKLLKTKGYRIFRETKEMKEV
jgi:NDP-sugar pyrophosphorylase family protein